MANGLSLRVLAVVVMLVFARMSTSAQNDTLSAEPLVIAQSACEIEARSIDEIGALLSSPVPRSSAEELEAVAAILGNDRGRFVMPDGEAANEATIAGVTQSLVVLYSCLAAGDQLAAASLMTDDWLRAQFIMTWTVAAATPGSATPTPVPALVVGSRMSIGAVRLLDEGRVGVLVQIESPDETIRYDFVLLENVVDRWLVAGLLDGVTMTATPVP